MNLMTEAHLAAVSTCWRRKMPPGSLVFICNNHNTVRLDQSKHTSCALKSLTDKIFVVIVMKLI